MKTHCVRLAIVLAAAFAPGVVMAQHEAHQPAPQASAGMASCAQVQPVVDNIIAAAMARLESARLSNSAAEMRAAVDHAESALRDVRTQLSPCTAAAAAADARPGHTLPGLQQSPGASAPAAPMDHSKMPMGGTPAARPGAATGAKPAPPAVSMDHSKMQMGEGKPGKVPDPVNGLMVDPATAPKTVYQGQTYYFSSEQTLKEFLENPAKFAKRPKG